MNKNNEEAKFVLKKGNLFIAERGLTSQQKYARQFTDQQARDKKQTLAVKNVFVEIEEVDL